MTIAEAVNQARQQLGPLAAEDDVAELAATLSLAAATPAELKRWAREEMEREVFEFLLEKAHDFTEEQIVAMELTPEQAARMAEARQR